jgi:putative oxidoreductase
MSIVSIVSVAALACIALNFVRAGCVHFLRFHAMCSMLASRGWPVPRTLLAAASALQIAAGLGLLWPPSRHASAIALLAFTICASVTLLDFWRLPGRERVGAANGFFSNVAVCGGLLLASVS